MKDIIDEIPAGCDSRNPDRELEYMRKIKEHTHHHFDRVAGEAL